MVYNNYAFLPCESLAARASHLLQQPCTSTDGGRFMEASAQVPPPARRGCGTWSKAGPADEPAVGAGLSDDDGSSSAGGSARRVPLADVIAMLQAPLRTPLQTPKSQRGRLLPHQDQLTTEGITNSAVLATNRPRSNGSRKRRSSSSVLIISTV
mmetsp:Transcript_7841/g.23585  ORF Transcript_7841/g.23585 Transcript_7841/m.23585 type:complete len:154 (-) Transcript_7841:2665-3126(-)